MTDAERRIDRAPTDEPDGTTAYAASLRPPGESLGPTDTDDETERAAAPGTAAFLGEGHAAFDVEERGDETAP